MNKKELFIAAILTFTIIVAWVVFDILHARSQVEISPKVKEIIEPISPDFSIKSLSQ